MQTDNVAVVTGSSSGNGFETSLPLAKNRFYTYATMRNHDKSKRMKEIVKKDNVIIPYLIEEYYIGFWTAMNFWGPDRANERRRVFPGFKEDARN